jgi:hypothetical protein
MQAANYHVYGIGRGINDVRYVGWTPKSVSGEQDEIFSELAQGGSRDIVHWVRDALDRGEISIFEIESAPSADEARDCAMYWRDCFRWLGLDVASDRP